MDAPPPIVYEIPSQTSNEKKPMTSPLLTPYDYPALDQITVDHIEPTVEALEEHTRKQLSIITALESPTWETLITPLEELQELNERLIIPILHLNSVKNTPAFREKWHELEPRVVALNLNVMQNPDLYKKMKTLRQNEKNLNNEQKRILDHLLLDAKLAGIELNKEAKEEFNEIKAKLSQLGSQFVNNTIDAIKEFSLILSSREEVEGLPPSLLALTSQAYNEQKEKGDQESTPESGPWKITLAPPVFQPFIQHCKSRDLREKLYRASITRSSFGNNDNTSLISEILRLRNREAELLDFATFAELSLATKMAGDVATVQNMLEQLREASWSASEKELEEVKKFAAESGEKEPLMHWDIPYWTERLREHQFSYTEEETRPYFPLPKALEGLFGLCNKLFGIEVQELTDRPPATNSDERFYIVKNEQGEKIASFYLDPYSRPENKRGGAWIQNFFSRRKKENTTQLPVVFVCCNFAPPIDKQPSLLTFRDLRTLFHEFGHALQHMLTTIDENLASGLNMIEWDAVEIASQFMENWCFHKPTLLSLSSHVETNKPLPEDLFEKIAATRTFMAGSQMLGQLRYGMLDLALHTKFQPTSDDYPSDVVKAITEKTSLLPYLPEERFLCSFSHIFGGGYAAGYYSYKWAEVMSSDAFGAFEESGLDNPEELKAKGREYRDTFLALGGAMHPLEVFRKFRGRDPSTTALLRHSGLLDTANK